MHKKNGKFYKKDIETYFYISGIESSPEITY